MSVINFKTHGDILSITLNTSIMKKYLIKLVLSVFLLKSMVLFAQAEPSYEQTLIGEIRDRISNTLLSNAKATLFDVEGNEIASQTVGENGIFTFGIECNKDYLLVANNEDYTAESKEFTTTIEVGKVLRMIVLLDKGNIDFLSNPMAKQVIVEAENIEQEVPTIETTIVAKEPVRDIPDEILKPRGDKYVMNIDPVYFDLGSSYFNKNNKEELVKILTFLKEHPTMKIEIGANSDVQGTSDYNRWLSDRRATRVKDFLVSGGIDSNRIITNSFGDTQIVNKCIKGVDCTDEEHAVNRRVEFVVVSM